MARMYPKVLPSHVRANPLRAAECRVYDALAAQLDDGFHVFYSSPWLGITEFGEEKDGEADFTIAHVEHGILVVEVKGGRIYLENDSRVWHSVDRNGVDHRIKNPVQQARGGKHNLLTSLGSRQEWNRRYINARHGVILCDTVRPGHDLAPDMPLRIFAFLEDMQHLNEWVLARYGCREEGERPGNTEPMGIQGIAALKAMLAGGIELQVDLRTCLDGDIDRIEILSDDQYGILEELEENPRMAIAGAAGTGKTVLAAQKAVLESRKGSSTLFVCFNRPLALYLQSRLVEHSDIEVSSFHELCRVTAEEAGLEPRSLYEDSHEFFERTLPDLFVSALSALPDKRYSAIVVDEGQDFRDEWLEALELALQDDDSTFYVFYDNNQQVMNRAAGYLRGMKAARRRLRKNFRNTRRIFEAASRFYVGEGVIPVGPDGEPILVRKSDSFVGAERRLRETLGYLITEKKIQPDRIAVLCGSRRQAEELRREGRIASYAVTDASERAPGFVIIDSIRRFKGLESDIVILYSADEYLDEIELLYVAATRARVLLGLIGTAGAASVICPSI